MSDLCNMCGKIKGISSFRWYRYDNGEMFREAVCAKCVNIHHQLLLKEGK